jgi:hypothetical protein
MPQRASVFCNFYIRVDREALVSERALNVGSVAFKAMSTKTLLSTEFTFFTSNHWLDYWDLKQIQWNWLVAFITYYIIFEKRGLKKVEQQCQIRWPSPQNPFSNFKWKCILKKCINILWNFGQVFCNKLFPGGERLKTGARLGKNMVYSYQFIKLTHYTVTLQSVNKKKNKVDKF